MMIKRGPKPQTTLTGSVQPPPPVSEPALTNQITPETAVPQVHVPLEAHVALKPIAVGAETTGSGETWWVPGIVISDTGTRIEIYRSEERPEGANRLRGAVGRKMLSLTGGLILLLVDASEDAATDVPVAAEPGETPAVAERGASAEKGE